MSKIWNVSMVTTFDPKFPGQHYLAVDDLGSFGSKKDAEFAAKKYLKEQDYEKVFDSDQMVIFKFGKHELHLESIYTAPQIMKDEK